MPKFTLRSLFVGTFLVALAISAIPMVLRIRFEALYVLSIILTVYLFALDLISKRESELWIGLRQCGSACALVLIFGVANQWLLPRPRFPFAYAYIIFYALILLLSSTAFFQLRRTSRFQFRLSFVGVAFMAALVAGNLFQVQGDWHLLRRSRQISSEPGNQGSVILQVRSQMRARRQQVNEFDLFFEYVDKNLLPSSFTKLRLMCAVDSIARLSFYEEMTPRDWRALSSQSRLLFLNLHHIDVSASRFPAIASLPILQELSLVECHLAEGFWQKLPLIDSLWTVRISGGTHHGLKGVAVQSELRSLRILNSQLTTDDLVEIAKLPNLTELELTGTNISNEQLIAFAEALNANKMRRLVQFKLTMNVDAASGELVDALLGTGAINKIDGGKVTFMPVDES